MKTLTLIFSLWVGAMMLGAFRTTACAAMPEEIKNRGEKLVDQGKLAEAFELTLPFAKGGDPEAQFSLGVLLLSDGIKLPPEYLGVTRSRLALCWIEKAALQGSAEACGVLADSYEKGFNGVAANPKLAELWRSMSKQGASAGR